MRFQLVQWLMIVAIGATGGRSAYPQGFSPEEAARRMTLAKGLKVTLFAGEPMVRQSIFVKCDDRGSRLDDSISAVSQSGRSQARKSGPLVANRL